MKLSSIISDVHRFNRCNFDDEWLVKLISDVDEVIYHDIILTHEKAPRERWVRYDEREGEDPDLFAFGTYSQLYRYYCDTEIYRVNGEDEKSNQAAALFNAAFAEFANYYNRTHMPHYHGDMRF